MPLQTRGFFIILFAAAVLSLHAAPPVQVLERLSGALSLLEKADVPTSYLVATRFTLADSGGKALQTSEILERVYLRPGEPARREQISRKTEGTDPDATSSASRRAGSGEPAPAWKLVFPVGEDRAAFEFGPDRAEGTILVCDFFPADKGRAKDGLTRGTIAWDPRSNLPVRLSATPIRNPPFTTEFRLAFDFSALTGFAYPAAVSFSGEGGFLFIRRRFDARSTISEFTRGR
jgi:hypothetical protein